MKQRAKGLFAVVFLGGILITSLVVIAIPGLEPAERDMGPAVPLDADLDRDYSANYNEGDRAMYCGTGSPPGSTDFIREFVIPTECTNPLAITVDYEGNPWFAESNTGRVGTFDVVTETFTEYPNVSWPEGLISMMWGMDYAPNGFVWFTDDRSDSLWVFNPETGQYGRLPFPAVVEDPFPQRIAVDGSQVIVNDFYGNMLAFLDPSNPESFRVAPSPIDGSVTSGFATDSDGYVWYTTWSYPDGDGYLVRFDYDGYVTAATNAGLAYLPPIDFVDLYALPDVIQTPNGITVSRDGAVWLADTSSSSFYEFIPSFQYFAQYVTADPMPSTYGNKTGVVISPISRPYWMSTDDAGRIVFNAQTSNTISVMDPALQKLVEYHVPSKNPHWTDCGVSGNDTIQDNTCGYAQVFDFVPYRDKIWFTEWAENKIGVVDTSVPLPFDVAPSTSLMLLAPGGSDVVSFEIVDTRIAAGGADEDEQVSETGPMSYAVSASEYVSAAIEDGGQPGTGMAGGDGALKYDVQITVSDDAPPGLYKVLLGAQAPDVSVGKFVTVTVQ